MTKNINLIRTAAFAAAVLTSYENGAAAQDFSTASGINNNGEIVGGSLLNDQSEFHGFILTHSQTVDLGTFGGPASRADSINDRGEAVGQSDTAMIDSNGEFISLGFLANREGIQVLNPLPGFKHSQAYSINNHGSAVGWSYNQHPTIPFAVLPNFQATVWENGESRLLGDLGGGNSVALAINNSGAIVGRSRLSNGTIHAFLHENGEMRDLGTLGGPRSEARAINSRGEIVGQAFLANGQRHATLWYREAVVDLGTLGGTYSRAWAINDHGQIVGESTTAYGELHAFLYDGTMHDLGTLGGGYSVAFGINNRGEIVGESENSSGDVHAFVVRDGIMVNLDGSLPQ